MSLVSSSAVFSKNFDMFVWTSGFQKSLAHTDFNMFVDERTSANESPEIHYTISHQYLHFYWSWEEVLYAEITLDEWIPKLALVLPYSQTHMNKWCLKLWYF